MPWYLILILVIGIAFGVFLLALGGGETAKEIREMKGLKRLDFPLHSLLHIASAPVEGDPMIIADTNTKERRETKS